jgi:hypothetical protein
VASVTGDPVRDVFVAGEHVVADGSLTGIVGTLRGGAGRGDAVQ